MSSTCFSLASLPSSVYDIVSFGTGIWFWHRLASSSTLFTPASLHNSVCNAFSFRRFASFKVWPLVPGIGTHPGLQTSCRHWSSSFNIQLAFLSIDYVFFPPLYNLATAGYQHTRFLFLFSNEVCEGDRHTQSSFSTGLRRGRTVHHGTAFVFSSLKGCTPRLLFSFQHPLMSPCVFKATFYEKVTKGGVSRFYCEGVGGGFGVWREWSFWNIPREWSFWREWSFGRKGSALEGVCLFWRAWSFGRKGSVFWKGFVEIPPRFNRFPLTSCHRYLRKPGFKGGGSEVLLRKGVGGDSRVRRSGLFKGGFVRDTNIHRLKNVYFMKVCLYVVSCECGLRFPSTPNHTGKIRGNVPVPSLESLAGIKTSGTQRSVKVQRPLNRPQIGPPENGWQITPTP